MDVEFQQCNKDDYQGPQRIRLYQLRNDPTASNTLTFKSRNQPNY